jgi:hypothetical protein
MQAPALAKPNYAHITRQALDALVNQLVLLKQAYEQAQAQQGQQPQGGFRRGVSPQAYVAKKKEVEDQLKTDTDAIDHMCTTHAAYIQSVLDRSKATLTSATRAVAAYEDDKNPQNAMQAATVTKAAAQSLDGLANAAIEADREYGAAWFPFRENLRLPDPNVDTDYFEHKRLDIIGRGKIIAAKVKKCGELHEQAKAYRAMSARYLEASQGLKTAKAETTKVVAALEAKLKKMFDENIDKRAKLGWDGDGRNWKSRQNAIALMTTKHITAQVKAEAASWMTELEATLKIYRNALKTMDTLYTTGAKPLTPKEAQREAKTLALAKAHVDAAKHIVAQADTITKATKVSADKIKNTHI